MNRFASIGLAVILTASVAMAQEQSSREQLEKLLADSLAQMKSLQDRKNELATRNTELQKQVDDLSAELGATKEALATLENRVYFYKEFQSKWDYFTNANALVATMWDEFLKPESYSRALEELLSDGRWSLSRRRDAIAHWSNEL